MRLIPLLPLLFLPLAAAAQQAMIYTQSLNGTGFFVNSNALITNAHVVRGCKSISILTPAGEQPATLQATDPQRDLAVLKTAYKSKMVAPLRWDIGALAVGDEVAVMGYPGTEGAAGHERYKKTRIAGLKGPLGESQWLQLDSVIEHGNSGGPVLDMRGNVIGVVTGMAFIYLRDSNGHLRDRNGAPTTEPVGKSDFAVTLPALQYFLQMQGIGFYKSASDLVTYGDDALHQRALDFIVPVHCIQSVTTVPVTR